MIRRLVGLAMIGWMSWVVIGAAACAGGDALAEQPLVEPWSAAAGSGSTPDTRHGDPSIFQAKDDLRILYMLLRLRKDTIQDDMRIVNALRQADWFTHVFLIVLSWQERPDAPRNPIVQRALTICRERGIKVIWGRWLWVAWPSDKLEAPMPVADSHFDSAYYATAIATLKAEARSLGAVGTFLDAEPYGHCAQKPTLKFKKLDDNDRQRIKRAVAGAVAHVGPVDFIYPTSSSRASHYAWPLAGLGRLRCDSKTYYSIGPDQVPKIRSPDGYEHRMDLWGCNVGLGRPQDHMKGQRKLTIQDVKSLDLSLIRKDYPHCKGVWVYADTSILAKVVEAFKN